MKVPITKPFFGEEEKEAVVGPIESGWIVQGPNVHRFESVFADYIDTKHAIATTSCTTALHLALSVLDIGVGDRVIMPSYTYVATANSINMTGAEIIFCDIDLNTYNMDPIELEKILNKEKNVTAIMVVTINGLCPDLKTICELAKKYNVKVIEDSACGFGAYLDGKHSGTFGDIGCFSFHPRKNITTGEGGMLVTDNDDYAKKAAILRDHGASRSDLERHKNKGYLLPEFNYAGFNYRMTDFQGAIGLAQMKKSKYILEKRKEIAEDYYINLADCPKLILPHIPGGYTHGWQAYECLYIEKPEYINALLIPDKELIDELSEKRNKFMDDLDISGVATRQGTHAVHTLGYYKNKYRHKPTDFINSFAADRLGILLPQYVDMTKEEFSYVISKMKEFL